MKRAPSTPPAEPRHLSRQKDDFTAEGAPPAPEQAGVPPPAQGITVTRPARKTAARTQAPGVRKGPPQGKYG